MMQLYLQINGALVATGIDSTTASGQANYAYPVNPITINKAGPVVIKFTATTNGTLYMNSLKLVKTADVTPSVPSISIETNVSASIRLNEKTGIRFYTEIDNAQIEALKADGYTVELGTLIAPKDLIENELTFESSSYLDVEYTAKNQDGSFKYYTEDGFTGVVGSIVKIQEKNLARDFVGRGYVKLTKDGVTTIVYSNSVSTRSAKFIATKIIAVEGWENNYTSEQADLIRKWSLVPDYKA